MMTYQEMNEFLTSFNTNSYNDTQVGKSKQLITTIYEYLNKLNIKKKNIEYIIDYIAYLNIDKLNIALYLELLSKSLGFAHSYSLSEVLSTVKEVHDIYYETSDTIPMEEYIHDTADEKIKKIFLNRNNKYLNKDFELPEAIQSVSSLKFASAVALESKEYKEFLSYIDNFAMVQDFYSPLLVFKTYYKVRKYLKSDKKLFWDIYFANEYVVGLVKHNMSIKDIFKKNIYSTYRNKKKYSDESTQLDLFTYLEEIQIESQYLTEDINSFQLCTIYNTKKHPEYNDEKDLILYYMNLIKGKETIFISKAKPTKISTYQYNMN